MAGSITLTLPTAGSVIAAGLHANNYTAIQAAVNALVNQNLTVFNVKDPAYGAKGDGVADDSAALQAAYNAAFAAGGGIVYLPVGTYRLNAAPILLTRNNGATRIPVVIRGSGKGATVFKLTATSKRLTQFNKVADGDTFRDIYLEDFSVDADNVNAYASVILGTYSDQISNVNFQDIAVRRVRAYNLPTNPDHSTSHMLGIHLTTYAASGGGTQYVTQRILFEDVEIDGGNMGIVVAGTPTSGLGPVNVLIDNIRLVRCRHTATGTPTVQQPNNNFQVGSYAYSDRIWIEDCIGENATDTAFEINSAGDLVVMGCVARDAANVNYLLKSFQAPARAGEQNAMFLNNRAEIVSMNGMSSTLPSYGFRLDAANGAVLGHVTLRDFVYYVNAQTNDPSGGNLIDAVGMSVRSLLIDNLTFDSPAYAVTTNTVASAGLIWIQPTNQCPITVKGAYCRIAGTRTSAGAGSSTLYFLQPSPVAGSFLSIEDVRADVNIARTTANYTFLMLGLGLDIGCNFDASITRLKALAMTGLTSSTGVNIGGTATLTIPKFIEITSSELSACANQVTVGAGNEGKVIYGTYACRAFLSGNQLIPNNAYTALLFASETFDTNAIHDTVTNTSRFTVGVAGKYLVSGLAQWASSAAGTVRAVRVLKNGATAGPDFDIVPAALSGLGDQLGADVWNLAAGDYLEMQVYQDSGGNLNALGTNTFFSITRLGA